MIHLTLVTAVMYLGYLRVAEACSFTDSTSSSSIDHGLLCSPLLT